MECTPLTYSTKHKRKREKNECVYLELDYLTFTIFRYCRVHKCQLEDNNRQESKKKSDVSYCIHCVVASKNIGDFVQGVFGSSHKESVRQLVIRINPITACNLIVVFQ